MVVVTKRRKKSSRVWVASRITRHTIREMATGVKAVAQHADGLEE